MTPRAAIIAGFAAILVLAVATDLLARRPGVRRPGARRSGARVRPLPVTLTAALSSRAGRVIIFAAWLWLGWHLLAR
ncbi:DUF6186 family protein [Paractinoplanes rhizophilus]|jgi:hypothetical protein|uniref:DUF6186 family protein n=1 Tax=Paractinoplanes rhizophilus TaxID=1416877 RepID=A0ABW2HNP5_9ACTN|nr:DUF6186 family protein [Actinoplanes sp.]